MRKEDKNEEERKREEGKKREGREENRAEDRPQRTLTTKETAGKECPPKDIKEQPEL